MQKKWSVEHLERHLDDVRGYLPVSHLREQAKAVERVGEVARGGADVELEAHVHIAHRQVLDP